MAACGRNRTTDRAPLFRFPFLRAREVHRMRDEEPRMIQSSLGSVGDDDESVRESLPDLLREFGFTARSFSSAAEFLASECVGQTNCLILDVGMPGMSGPELQRELKLRGQTIPFVFITANRDEAVRPRVLAQGAVACLFKRFSDTALLEALNTALQANWAIAALFPSLRYRMVGAFAFGHKFVLSRLSHAVPIVFGVDDDVSVRESLELLIRCEGWQPEIFASAQEFLSRPRVLVPSCLILDFFLQGFIGLVLQKRIASDRV